VELPDAVLTVLSETASELKGAARRRFMARTVCELFDGVINRAVRVLGWDERTLRKALHEWRSGITCLDGRSAAGQPGVVRRHPDLLADLRAIVDGQSQIDPRFQSQRLYTRLTVAEIRRQLVAQKGYTEATLPSPETIRVKVNDLGYRLRRVAKVKPKKRFPRPTPSSTK
jgi:hypothetical protein